VVNRIRRPGREGAAGQRLFRAVPSSPEPVYLRGGQARAVELEPFRPCWFVPMYQDRGFREASGGRYRGFSLATSPFAAQRRRTTCNAPRVANAVCHTLCGKLFVSVVFPALIPAMNRMGQLEGNEPSPITCPSPVFLYLYTGGIVD